MAYTVKKLASLSGVSVRTLHYYDEIGLLSPAFLGGNGYRYYEDEQLLRLQQILFYRELDVELKSIQSILDDPDFDHISALKSHQLRLMNELERKQQLISNIAKTIEQLKGNQKMNNEELFEGFAPEKQEEHEQYLIDRCGFFDNSSGINLSRDSEFTGYKVKHSGHVYG
jgi:DNA-binding transcriptional MerR regulator